MHQNVEKEQTTDYTDYKEKNKHSNNIHIP